MTLLAHHAGLRERGPTLFCTGKTRNKLRYKWQVIQQPYFSSRTRSSNNDDNDDYKITGKIYPTTGIENSNGKQRDSSTVLASALHGGGWPTPRSRGFTPGKETPYPL
jgi:hypothetical protein